MRLLLPLILAITLSAGPAWASAELPAPEPAPEPAPTKKVDDLGREYPNPELLKRSRTWSGLGIGFTAAGSGMLVTGLFLGSGYARGELTPPTIGNLNTTQSALVPTLTLFGAGVVFAFVGIPTVSAGLYMNKQLRRTIKGAEKIPRTVGNEARYWNAYIGKMFAQTLMVGGGGSILLGTLGMVAVGALVATDRYDPLYWLIPAGMFVGGGTMLGSGLALNKKSKERMEAVFDEVDPMRQKQASVYSLGPRISVTRHGRDEVRTSFGWTFAF
ncbi:MAG: hypothetical protein GY898_27045 [Proteobacteria bacterium]|nr:hypothetical protein [Pseudomonadota bacterium]